MQKVWRQIGFSFENLEVLHGLMTDFNLKNETQAIEEVFIQLKRFRTVVQRLETQAHKQQDIINAPEALQNQTEGAKKK